MPLRFATPGCLVLSTRRCLKAMASLAGQYTRMQEFTVVFTVLRLLAPLKMSYVAAKKQANLYTKIVEELPQSVERRGSWYDRPSAKAVAYVLVNNRSEGNAPLSVQALAEMLRA
jgi:hypothetical protein